MTSALDSGSAGELLANEDADEELRTDELDCLDEELSTEELDCLGKELGAEELLWLEELSVEDELSTIALVELCCWLLR